MTYCTVAGLWKLANNTPAASRRIRAVPVFGTVSDSDGNAVIPTAEEFETNASGVASVQLHAGQYVFSFNPLAKGETRGWLGSVPSQATCEPGDLFEIPPAVALPEINSVFEARDAAAMSAQAAAGSAALADPWVVLPGVSTAGGAQVLITDLPAGVTEIEMDFGKTSLNATSPIIFQLGTSAGYLQTGYSSAFQVGSTLTADTTGLKIYSNSAAVSFVGRINARALAGGLWSMTANIGYSDTGGAGVGSSFVDLGGTLTSCRIFRSDTGSFDFGAAHVRYR